MREPRFTAASLCLRVAARFRVVENLWDGNVLRQHLNNQLLHSFDSCELLLVSREYSITLQQCSEGMHDPRIGRTRVRPSVVSRSQESL